MTMINSIIQAAAFLFPLWLLYLNFKWHSFWRVRNVPGPTPWPIFGTTIYYLLGPKVEVDLEWTKNYGGVYGIYEGYSPVLKVSDSRLVDHILVKNHKQYLDRTIRGANSHGMRSWIFFSKGDKWTNKRLLISPMFTSAKLNFYSKVMTDCVEEFFTQIEKPGARALAGKPTSDSGTLEGSGAAKVVDRNHFMSLALDIMCRVLHSCKINTYQGAESEFHKKAFAFSSFDVAYWILWSLLPRKLCEYFQLDLTPASKLDYLKKLSKNLLEQRRRDLSEQKITKKPDDIIQMMLEAKIPEEKEQVYETNDDMDSHFNNNMDHQALEKIHQDQIDSTNITFRQFDDNERSSQMTFFFSAGFDTTSMSLTFCFHSLARYQLEQQIVFEEVLACKKQKQQLESQSNGTSDKRDNELVLDWQDVIKLEKLDSFISEVLRIYPAVTMLNRVVSAKEGVVLPSRNPIRLPHESVIYFDPFVIHRDPANWDHPEKFDMNRFSAENKSKIARGSYLPFGIGPRNCVAYRFASLILKQVVANVVLRYHVMPMPGNLNRKEQDVSAETGSQYKTHPFFLQLKKNSFVLVPRN